ncbi:Oidioi.mRNA.OKI2018_I69.XSR.g16904.t1.cds [Oikopleura dioica]|uniref:Oidioi.mRNA.OKI2018_I69.XSR.g16904.t1.cds n=1 Tax=Oikopleura dioica TaxID=34765 RepID=A0ABN7SMQ4_OIKDI|nr:Oidioi.mRNA.OKI2018_I69.XSR.g16904.t1.cds [Oikopleura dioica]
MTDRKKHARLIIVNPGGKKENAYKDPENDENYARTLNKIGQLLKLEAEDDDKGYHYIITQSKFSEAKDEMEKIYKSIKEECNNEDDLTLIAVVLKDGFYSRDGDAIQFDEGPRLIEAFFRPIYQDPDRINLRRIRLCVMSFHSRIFSQADEKLRRSVEDEENPRNHIFSKAWDNGLCYEHLVSGKLNTMKIFYCRREETFSFDEERIEIFADFIKQMSSSKNERSIEKILLKDFFSLTHSLVDDVFVLKPKPLDGKPLFASMVVEVDNDLDEDPSVTTITKDEENFSAAINHFFKDPEIMTIRKENILKPCKNWKKRFNAVMEQDAKNYFQRIKNKMIEKNPSAVIIYLDSHGYFDEGGKYMKLSKISDRKNEEDKVCIETLLKILDEDDDDEKTETLRSIPKIVINDCCYVKEGRKNPRTQDILIPEIHDPQRKAAGGARKCPNPTNNESTPKDKMLKQKMNTIIFHPSTEQDFAYGCSMLNAIISCWNENFKSTTVDIMDLAFR